MTSRYDDSLQRFFILIVIVIYIFILFFIPIPIVIVILILFIIHILIFVVIVIQQREDLLHGVVEVPGVVDAVINLLQQPKVFNFRDLFYK